MSEDTQAENAQQEVTEPSLDDVIAEYNVQPQVQNTAQQQPAPQVPQVSNNAPSVDPLDQDSFNGYVNQVASGQSVLNEQLQDVKTQLTELQQERARLQVETDINNAVETLNENLKLNPKLVRVHLEYMAQEKPGFKQLWENRGTNPKAFEKALNAVGREMRDLYAVKQDEGLAETQAAIQKSQQSLSGSNSKSGSNSTEEALAAASGADFDRMWNDIAHGGM